MFHPKKRKKKFLNFEKVRVKENVYKMPLLRTIK